MLLPLLTEPDPVVSSEGSLDPLGLYAVADSLATRLIPGVRERQSHPRFLTSITVAMAVCSEFDEETVAADGVSEPWQVFEWYVVEGLVRTISDGSRIRGLPGREKALTAIKDGVPLSASRYLKSPSVFGFHGTYRILSRELGIEASGRMGENGYDLLVTWMKEHGLNGFYGSSHGPGTMWRKQLTDAVKDGLEKGAVARKTGWSGWEFFNKYLAHHDMGKQEANAIKGALLDADHHNFRKPVLDFLVSQSGRTVWDESTSERNFHEAILLECDDELSALLRAIMTYESFSRLLQDAFDDCLFVMSQKKVKTGLKEFESLNSVKQAAEKVPMLFSELIEILAPFGETLRCQDNFSDVAEKLPVLNWVECLLEHHRKIQRNKPPNGKSPWFERFDDGTYMIRPGYLRSTGGKHNNEYVHYFRTNSLWSFAKDMYMVE